jgi:addiction module RelE/StbE family toxin
MVKIVWSDIAIDDLKTIHEYISKDSRRYADQMIEIILKRVEQLENFPKSGRIVPEFNQKTIRELIQDNYRIVYTIEDQFVAISRIHHSAKKIE